MIVYRITGSKHASDISGTGTAMYGGRWNKKGTSVLYTGESKEIALLETIVHTPPMLVPNLNILTIEIPDNSITELRKDELPKNWLDYPAPTILSEIGDAWIQDGETLALKVPSCIIHSAFIYILNCRYTRYREVKLLSNKKFHFDSRLITK
jgi:RES domain-containing protein